MGNCNKKEGNMQDLQDEILEGRMKPIRQAPNGLTIDVDNNSMDSYDQASSANMGGNTNSMDIPGNLWQVETKTTDQLLNEIGE